MDTDERITDLEKRLERYDRLILALTRFAAKSTKGRFILTALGIPKELWT